MMALDLDILMNLDIPPVEQTLEARDIILYALGVGLGSDPMDLQQLRFVYEKELRMLPTMALVLGSAGSITQYGDTGITRTHVVHGEQGFVIHRTLPVSGKVVGTTHVSGVVDKGEGRGAVAYTETVIREVTNDAPLITLTSSTFCRADGGFGGPPGPVPPIHTVPNTTPDFVCDLETLPQAALIYRLSGDYNPLHADPLYAKRGGFDQPILHGRCTFGIVGHALLKTCCDYDPTRLVAMQGRFSAPVFPGESIRTEMWQAGETVSFRATVPARGATVISNGKARIQATV